MSNILTNIQDNILTISFNRPHKHNAFNDELLSDLQIILDQAQNNHQIHAVILTANGKNFSAGADLNWMQKMSCMNEDENLADAQKFSHLMYTLYNFSKPIIAMVHGKTIGGGVGLIAACDIVITEKNATFACPEVKIGLIPAVISPYVIRAIGERAAKWLFLSAQTINAQRAYELQLVHYVVEYKELLSFTYKIAQQIIINAPQAMSETKKLVNYVIENNNLAKLKTITASLIAKQRVSDEGKKGISDFLTRSHNV